MAESEPSSDVEVPAPFERFYQEEYAAVVALIYGLTGMSWTAEELAQDAFLRAHRDWSRVREMDSPGGWIRRVAINLARSRLRRVRAEARASLRLGRPTAASQPASPVEIDVFWEEVRRLPTRQAQAVALRYIEELSLAEIANVLNIAEGTVKALLHQGRERLRRQLRAKGLFEE